MKEIILMSKETLIFFEELVGLLSAQAQLSPLFQLNF